MPLFASSFPRIFASFHEDHALLFRCSKTNNLAAVLSATLTPLSALCSPIAFFRRMASITPSHRHQAVSGRYQNVSVNAKKKSFTKSETLGSFRSVHSSSKTAAAEKSEPYKTETVSKRRANSMYRIPRNKEKTTTIFARFDHPLLLP
nr:hypothetical protein [Geobacillus proteiniphilus]